MKLLSGNNRQDSRRKMFDIKCCVAFRAAAFLALISFMEGSLVFVAQTPPKKTDQQQGMGVSTGTPVNYTSRRTVGITDPKAPVIFEDITDKTAMANFRHRSGTPAKDYIFETPSGGVAIFDYDGDGLPDIYFVNGSTLPAMQGKEKPPRAALYHNLGNLKFEDVTDKAGVANERWASAWPLETTTMMVGKTCL